MKTFWKTKTDQRWAMEKRREFESKTGVKWNWFMAHGGFMFTPIIDAETDVDPIVGEYLLEKMNDLTFKQRKFGISLLTLVELAEMPMKNVLEGARWLILKRKVFGVVCRTGRVAGIRPRVD